MSTPVTPNDRPGNDNAGNDRPGGVGPGNDRSGSDRIGSEQSGSSRVGSEQAGTARIGDDKTRTEANRERTVAPTTTPDRRDVINRQKEQFGGMKIGCSFFGWLTATGTAVLLTGLLAAVGAALGLGRNVDPAAPVGGDVRTASLVGAIIAAAVVLVAYFCGGYVAARMARFNGLKQGLGVWLWALIAAVVVTILALILGDRFNMLSSLNGVIPIPASREAMTTASIITAVAIILVSLVGALLGGLAGMRFHRRVDRAGFDAV